MITGSGLTICDLTIMTASLSVLMMAAAIAVAAVIMIFGCVKLLPDLVFDIVNVNAAQFCLLVFFCLC